LVDCRWETQFQKDYRHPVGYVSFSIFKVSDSKREITADIVKLVEYHDHIDNCCGIRSDSTERGGV